MRGGRRGGPWSEEEIASSGTGSERAKVASVAERKPPASTWHREARTGEGDVLHHDPDLLRERRPPHRPRLHADRLRRARAAAPDEGAEGLLPHGDRRARGEGEQEPVPAGDHPEVARRPRRPPLP